MDGCAQPGHANINKIQARLIARHYRTARVLNRIGGTIAEIEWLAGWENSGLSAGWQAKACPTFAASAMLCATSSDRCAQCRWRCRRNTHRSPVAARPTRGGRQQLL